MSAYDDDFWNQLYYYSDLKDGLTVISSVLLIIGVAYTFLGAKLYSILHGLICAVIGFWFSFVLTIIFQNLNEKVNPRYIDLTVPFIVGGVVGLLFGIMCFFCKRLQACILGAQVGICISNVGYAIFLSFWNHNQTVYLIWTSVFIITFFILGCIYPNKMLVYLTAFIGSLNVAFSVADLTGHSFSGRIHWTLALFIGGAVVLFFLGVLVQRALGFHKIKEFDEN